MVNNEQPNDKTNYNGVFLRDVIVGFRGFLMNRFSWVNETESGPVKVTLPIHYSLTGDNRYVMDAFYDDMPDKRVNMNTDSIPRGVITLKSWSVKPDEFTNPNVWLNINKEIDGELQQVVMQTKAVPVKLSFTLETQVDSEIDIMKSWQTYMDNMWLYKYFTFDYANVPINAVFNFVSDTENQMIRSFKFGESGSEGWKTVYNFDIHTFYPIFDTTQTFKANQQAQWIIALWQNTNHPNTPLNSN